MQKTLLIASALALTAFASAPASAVTGEKPAIQKLTKKMDYRDRDWREERRDRRRAWRDDDDRYRGWHRYSHRPYGWRDRGCLALGPVWVCP